MSDPKRVSSASMLAGYLQDPPHLGNQFEEDLFLQSVLKRLAPADVYEEIAPDLERFGDRVWRELWPIAKQMDLPENQPRLRQHTAWGKRLDDIETCDGWKHMKRVCAEEGLISIGYERKHGASSRLYQFAKLYLWCPSSGLFSCPMAMTDGAARLIECALNGHQAEAFDTKASSAAVLRDAFKHLTSRAPDEFWTSGQWMTERKGGSDVAQGTETIARVPAGSITQELPQYDLYGYKWFTSATDADMTFTLARVEDTKSRSVREGSGGLSCFFLRVRNDSGELNNIRIVKLKNKLGTKQLPTAELELQGARAQMVSLEGRGVSTIVNMVNITRLYNAISACSGMRRMVALCRDYCHRRHVFGSLLSENPLHLETLAELDIKSRAALLFTLDTAALLGAVECAELGGASVNPSQDADSALLRLLTPLVKLYTAKLGVAVASEGLECFGGQGYIEETSLPGMLRDAQVLPIWEGTTNVLSMDMMRAASKTKGASLAVFAQVIKRRCDAAKASDLRLEAQQVMESLNTIQRYLTSSSLDALTCRARDLSFSLSRIYIGSLMIQHALWSGDVKDQWVAKQWIAGAVNGVGPMVAATISAELQKTEAAHDRASLVRLVALGCDKQGRATGYGRVTANGSIRAAM